MTKQEEIRQGTIEFWRDAGEKLTRARTTELTDIYLGWLAGKGVVIKVNGELPSIFDVNENVISALEYKKKLEDYVAVEPLIEAPTIEI